MNYSASDNSYLEVSSRIQCAIKEGEAPSAGSSCNTFVVEDSIRGASGISEALKWSTDVSSLQGAPTLILSNLRANNAPLSTGGTSSGPCSFTRIFDEIAEAIRRPTKKNGVVVAFLDADHPDILEWISPEFKAGLSRMYTGVILREGVRYNQKVLAAIANAYDSWNLSYICKIQRDRDQNWIYPNVCTEIRQIHKGQCILGALKLYDLPVPRPEYYAHDLEVWRVAFRESMAEMISYLALGWRASEKNPDLFQFEKQIGLGFVGFANAMGKFGATYQGLAKFLPIVEKVAKAGHDLPTLLTRLQAPSDDDRSLIFLATLITGIMAGSDVANDAGMLRVWTQQPTTHTSLRLKDGDYSVAAEIQPPYAVRGQDGLSRSRQVSALRGDHDLVYPESVQTRDEVDYETYRQVSCLIQLLFNITGMAHTLSHCYYGEKFQIEDLKTFIKSPLLSLYYRLPSTPAQVYLKDATLDDEGTLTSEVTDDDFLAMLGSTVKDPTPTVTCPINAGPDCETCSM